MEIKDYTKLIPDPPADLVDWLRRKKQLSKEWLIFKCGDKKNVLDVVCTACGAKFEAERLPDMSLEKGCGHAAYYAYLNVQYRGRVGGKIIEEKKNIRCPYCRHTVECVHVSKFRYSEPLTEYAWPLVISKVDGVIIAAGYSVQQRFTKDGRKSIDVKEHEAYVFDNAHVTRLTGAQRNFTTMWYLGYWRQLKRYSDEWKDGSALIYYTQNNVFKNTRYEHCRLKQYVRQAKDKSRPIDYLNIFKRYPQIENLITSGFAYLLEKADYYSKGIDLSLLNMKEQSPRRMLGLNKPDFEYMKTAKLNIDDIRNFRKLREILPAAEARQLAQMIKDYSFRIDVIIAEGAGALKLCNYIDRIYRKKKHITKTGVLSDWLDYIRYAGQLEYNINDPVIRFPADLTRAHDRVVEAVKHEEQKELRERFEAMFEKIAPLAWSDGTFEILPARSERELINEGEQLGHCVGGYGKAHCGASPIFFIRKCSDPAEPFFTLQLNLASRTVIQNRGRHNCTPPKKVNDFVEQWLEKVVRPYGFKKQKKAAGKRSAA